MDTRREEVASPVSETLPPLTPSGRLESQAEVDSYLGICRLAAPLVLATSGFMLMHLLDAIFLARYSEEAIAAQGPASMAGFTVTSLFLGVSGYASTFVAQYVGARRAERAGAAIWQAIYFSGLAAVIVAAVGLLGEPLFRAIGHAPALQRIETLYFQIICFSALLPLLSTTLSSFFVGRGDNTTLMVVQVAGLVLNGVLSYALIFGWLGLPSYGAAGAAVATAIAQGVNAVVLAVLFLRPGHRRRFNTWRARALEWELFKRLIRFGLPAGMRFVIEMIAYTGFLCIVGRLGTTELAATNIAWRINGFAFFPLVGLASAIATVVGNAQGRQRPDVAERNAYRGLLLAEAWTLIAVALFLLLPRHLLLLFGEHDHGAEGLAAEKVEMGVMLLRFVALYCLLDTANIIFLGALQGAGDTRWTFAVSATVHVLFVAAMVVCINQGAGLYHLWAVMTVVVMAQTVIWVSRFRAGHWKTMRVIEAPAEDGG
ncbi:MAG: MATE family efflux transporter [Planctomycetota bacterium]|nr:MATE family efflux transporter [Planctomycetota bacterium]